MTRTRKGWAIVVCTLLVALIVVGMILVRQEASLEVRTERQFPQPAGWINDFGHLLTEEERRALEKKAAEFENRTSVELTVVTVETLSPYLTIEPYATKLFNEWGLGKQRQNNGLLLLVAIKERAVRIEVGYGLESTLTNAKCKEILQTQVTPFLQSGSYFQALQNGMDAMIKIVEQP